MVFIVQVFIRIFCHIRRFSSLSWFWFLSIFYFGRGRVYNYVRSVVTHCALCRSNIAYLFYLNTRFTFICIYLFIYLFMHFGFFSSNYNTFNDQYECKIHYSVWFLHCPVILILCIWVPSNFVNTFHLNNLCIFSLFASSAEQNTNCSL